MSPSTVSEPITRLSQFRDHGCVLISHCSLRSSHEHVIDLDSAIEKFGDVETDYDFRTSVTCPECGAPGGGLTIRMPPSGLSF